MFSSRWRFSSSERVIFVAQFLNLQYVYMVHWTLISKAQENLNFHDRTPINLSLQLLSLLPVDICGLLLSHFFERFLVSFIFLIHNYVDFWDWLATLGVCFGCSAGRDDGWGSVPGKYRERIPHASADPAGDPVTLWGHADVPGNVPECCCFDWPACWSVSTGVLYAGGPSRPHDALLRQYSKLLKEWWWFPWQYHLLFLKASQVYLENSIWWEKEK